MLPTQRAEYNKGTIWGRTFFGMLTVLQHIPTMYSVDWQANKKARINLISLLFICFYFAIASASLENGSPNSICLNISSLFPSTKN